jgi:hypothetical protein
MVVGVSGCAPSSPVVANPIDPWEEELSRERQAAELSESKSPQSSVARQMYGVDEEEKKQSEHSTVVVAITDIIGFPFRGAGWLVRQIF